MAAIVGSSLAQTKLLRKSSHGIFRDCHAKAPALEYKMSSAQKPGQRNSEKSLIVSGIQSVMAAITAGMLIFFKIQKWF